MFIFYAHSLSHYLAIIIIIYPGPELDVNSIVILPSLIISLLRCLPCGNINDTPVYSLGKMLHQYILCAYEIVHDSKYSCSLVIVLRYVQHFLGAITRIDILVMFL